MAPNITDGTKHLLSVSLMFSTWVSHLNTGSLSTPWIQRVSNHQLSLMEMFVFYLHQFPLVIHVSTYNRLNSTNIVS